MLHTTTSLESVRTSRLLLDFWVFFVLQQNKDRWDLLMANCPAKSNNLLFSNIQFSLKVKETASSFYKGSTIGEIRKVIYSTKVNGWENWDACCIFPLNHPNEWCISVQPQQFINSMWIYFSLHCLLKMQRLQRISWSIYKTQKFCPP